MNNGGTLITTESQMAYLFQRVKDLEWEVRHYQGKDEEHRELISQIQDRLDVLSDAIVDVLHGKSGEETYEQAFNRIMERLDREGVA